MTSTTHRFAAMGTTFAFVVEAPDTAATRRAMTDGEAVVRRLESRLSRFREGSELSALNRLGRARVGDDMIALTRLALDGRRDTGGRFDPTVHGAIVAAGYDRSFEALDPGGADVTPRPHCGGTVTLDDGAGVIALDEGVGLDLGGIAKGYAAEMACGVLDDAGPGLVSAGGDIAVRGRPAAEVWPVEVATPEGALVIGIAGGGIATSGRDRRTWRRNGTPMHHIIDPATGRPATTDVLRVTVAAGSAVRAEILATALLVSGARNAIAEAEARGVAALVVTDDGRTLTTEDIT